MESIFVCVLLLLANSCLVIAGTECEVDKDDPCRCTAYLKDLNITVDISGTLKYPATAITDKYTYTYSACEEIACVKGGENANGRLCQSGTGYSIGDTIQSWTIIKHSPELEFAIVYTGGEGGRESTVTFTYVENQKDKFGYTEGGGGKYQFTVQGEGVAPYSPTAPPHTGGGGGGGNKAGPIGLALISLSIVTVVTYFVVGALVNYFHLGARGVEIIPQYAFWKDVPFLIKDGFFFTISPCYKRDKDYQSL